MVDEGIRMILYQSCELLGRRSLHLTFLDRTDKKLIIRLCRILAFDIPGEAD